MGKTKGKEAKEMAKVETIGIFRDGLADMTGILTTVTVLGNAHINAKRLATLTGLYAASQSDLQAFKKKVQEMVKVETIGIFRDDVTDLVESTANFEEDDA